MSAMRKLAPFAVLALLLTGCSAPPSIDEVAERFLIELTDSQTLRDGLQEFGEQVADDALDGQCGSAAYETGLAKNGDDNLVYAWRVTCLTYFEGDLTASQVAETKRMLLDRIADESSD